MAQFHFVEDYERLVADLIATRPIDEAMSLAVGGLYEEIGAIEANLLRHAGLKDGMSLVDLGCGSGRLAHAVGSSMSISYTGIDIVQALLDYAKSKAPDSYRFILHRELSIPLDDNSHDFIAAFSVFTHLLHAESYIYLDESRRVLKPGGKLAFSFLEFAYAGHWSTFQSTVDAQRNNTAPHLNTFIERSTIEVWCERLGFIREDFISATESRWPGAALGQATAILQKPG
jgi:ubiquinone/menaquinone biosynthesis C-methylase UbiE